MARRLYLAYASTTTRPTGSGAIASTYQAHYYDTSFFMDVDHQTVAIEHEMLNKSVVVDNLGYHMKLSVKLSPTDINLDRNFLQAFLTAKHKWALTTEVDGSTLYFLNFHNTDDDSDGWVKCRLDGDEHGTSVQELMEDGFTLISEKIYTIPEVPVNLCAEIVNDNKISLKWGAPTAVYADWYDRLSKCSVPLYQIWMKRDSGSYSLVATTHSRSYQITIFEAGVWHSYIRAINGYGYSDSSEVDKTIIAG